MLKASFIIPSYNSFKTIFRTLDSIFALKDASQVHEVIVVDCSDDDVTKPMLKTYGSSKLRLVELPQKGSPGHSRNTGAAMATGEVLCFIDSDVYLDESWLEQVLNAYTCGCQAGGGSVGAPDFQHKNRLALAQLYLQFNESLNVGKLRRVSMLPACNMFVQRKLFQQVGGFPLLRAAEDVLFCLECAQYTSLWFVPEAKCFHIFREEKKPYFQNQKILGQYIMVYRRMLYNKWYYTKPWSSLLLPIFVVIKAGRITMRILRAGGVHMKDFIFSLPLFLAGLFYWAVGFYQESLCGHSEATPKNLKMN